MQYTNSYFTLDVENRQVYMNFYPAVSGGEELKLNEIVEVLERNRVEDFDKNDIYRNIMAASGPVRFLVSTKPILEYDEYMDLKITPDGMYAIARFFPPSGGGNRMSEHELRRDLEYNKVEYGISEQAIAKHLDQPEYFKNIVLATGVKPIQGHDGFITYKFNTDRKAKPHVNEDGTVDFHQLNNIAHVRRGDVLAVMTPTDLGTAGMSVYGKEVKPEKVAKVTFKYGKNIDVSEDGTLLITRVDGYATLEGDKVFVSNVYDIPNDVDNSTGDVQFNGAIVVHGNVRAGFKLKAEGNIEVFGVVEGATLEAGGDVILHRGIQGMYKCLITAKGNLVSKFIENATVMVDGYVTADSIMNSHVAAKGDVTVSGRGGSIIGGVVTSVSLIDATTIGTALGASTMVEVGIDPATRERMKEIQLELTNKNAEIEKLNQLVTLFRKKQEMGTLESDKVKMISQFTQSIIMGKIQIKELKAEYEEKQALMKENEFAKIRVTKDIFAGTKITISGESLILKDTRSHCVYSKKDGEIVSSVW